MYCCLIGRIVELNLKIAVIEDLRSKEKFTCKLDGDESLEVNVGEEAVFIGRMRGGEIIVKRIDIRKFLDPLYEDDMLRTAGLTTLIAPIDDPFPEMFLRFQAIEMKRMEDEKAAEEAEESQPSADYAEAKGA